VNLEENLTEELGTVARSLTTPPAPSVTDLVRRAERARARSRRTAVGVSGLVAAVVVGAVVLGTQLGDPRATGPGPTHRSGVLPTGAPPAIPYVDGTTLYVGNVAQPGRYYGVDVAGSSAVAYPGAGVVAPHSVALFRQGVKIRDIATDLAVLSPDGTRAAWVEVTKRSAHLVVYDVDAEKVVGRLKVRRSLYADDVAETEARERVGSVTDNGTVTYGGVVVTHTWKPGWDPVDEVPQDVPTTTPGFPDDARDVVVNPYGTWGAWATGTDGRSGPYDDEDPALADAITFERPDRPATLVTVPISPHQLVDSITWETENAALVAIQGRADGPVTYVRCDVSRRTCQVAPVPGDR
jgi:hypothetical protein